MIGGLRVRGTGGMDSFGRGAESSDRLVVVRRCGSGVWEAGVEYKTHVSP